MQVPLQPSPLWGENVGKIYSTWIFGITPKLAGRMLPGVSFAISAGLRGHRLVGRVGMNHNEMVKS